MELAFFNGHQDMISSYYKCLQSAGNWCTILYSTRMKIATQQSALY